ncbi:tRNA lysidine(34) synthetase TilS [Aureimonas sp. AU12]|uniref:tRNA lysidine(34) synthetase TilS n=1 Tax=Aureimonas sp. AU12 TaxID=1638161 RepID=UPI000783422A|nr:tRNA lysidine(34) synthetase TilS [Aureimonas sp. AU12]
MSDLGSRAGALRQGWRTGQAARAIAPGLLLAVSGGPDSLAMLIAAAEWRTSDALVPPLAVATVDHGLRPESSAEARFVAEICGELGLPHRTLNWQPAALRGNLAAAARAARYGLLALEARRLGAGALATAHHRDDQIETHLLARERGALGPASAGMRDWRDLEPGLVLLRPFLGIERGALAKDVRRAGLRAIDDPTNRDVRYRRAALRLAIDRGEVDRDAALAALGSAGRERDAADAALALRLAELRHEGRLELTDAGAIVIDRWQSADQPLLSRFVTAAGGGAEAPATQAIARLGERLSCEGDVSSTLAGCRIERRGGRLEWNREFGRSAPAPVQLGLLAVCFDGRFDIDARAVPDPDVGPVLALGAIGLGNWRDRTLPVLTDDSGRVRAAHRHLLERFPGAAELPLRCRIGWRIAANLPVRTPFALTAGLQIAANGTEPVGKDLADTYLR